MRALTGQLARIAWLGLGFLLAPGPLAAAPWHNVDVSDSPPLALAMTDADTGQVVHAADFRGKVVLAYLGYTQCPDICPLTLGNITQVLHRLGKDADHVRVLFITVDPHRDTLSLLHDYTTAFAPEIVGLRPGADQLAAFARRYRLAYSVTPASPGHPYDVSHSSAIYAFDGTGRARLLIPSLASADPDISGTAADLEQLLHAGQGGFWARLVALF